MTQAVIYTDGSRLASGIGAWAFRIECEDGSVQEKFKSSHNTTNQREELKAIGYALIEVWALDNLRRFHKQPRLTEILIISDSLYALNTAKGAWRRKANLDLFETFQPFFDDPRLRFQHVRGHSGNPGNERVDKLATQAAQFEQSSQRLWEQSRAAG